MQELKKELIKPTISVGNGTGVLLPKSWKNSTVRVSLVEKPRLEEILKIVNPKEVQGIYLCGSYAKNEQTKKSDIDILIITHNKTKTEKMGKYEINYLSRKDLNKQGLILYYPMILEAKPLFNESLLEDLKKEIYIPKKILLEYIKYTKKMLELNEKQIKLAKLEEKNTITDNVGYSLVLRLRTYYILKCIKEKKPWKKNKFLKLIKEITQNHKAYSSYLNGKQKNQKLFYLYKMQKKF
jgi:predicted nucleotidyltransferase